MHSRIRICLALAAASLMAQPKLSFEVATIKPSAPMDQAKMMAAMQGGGGKIPFGARASRVQEEMKTVPTFVPVLAR